MSVDTGRFSCARDATARGEPLRATASTFRRWLILEQPGPWGRDAVPESRVGERTGSELKRLARSLRARIILIRRHGREDTDVEGHRLYVAHTGPDEAWMERFDVPAPEGVLDLELAPLGAGEPCGGRPVDGTLYLVCTNGRHDACCAEYGRPLAAALDALRPRRAWECSHIGGDRFAANLLCMPHGLYYGRVTEGDAERVITTHEDGRLALDRYRGRSSYPFHAQAVDHAIRTAQRLDGIDDLRLVDAGHPSDGIARVVFDAADGRRFTVHVAIQADPVGRLLTCRAEARACPPRYEVVDIDVAITG